MDVSPRFVRRLRQVWPGLVEIAFASRDAGRAWLWFPYGPGAAEAAVSAKPFPARDPSTAAALRPLAHLLERDVLLGCGKDRGLQLAVFAGGARLVGGRRGLALYGTDSVRLWAVGDPPPLPEPGVLLPLSLEPDPPAAQACLAALVREERARRAALLLREKKRLERLLAHVDEDLARFEVLERERHAAELLKGQLQRVSRGMAEVELEDWYADPPGAVLKLALDPALSPVENMEKIFRRAARSARGKTEAARRREEVLAALVRLETSSRLLEGVPGEDAAGLLAFPMPGIGKTAQPSRGRKAAGGHPAAGGEPFRRIPVGGALCLVGKSALGNETVSFREAAGRDLWFHTHNYPGSHVLLKRPNRAYAFSDGEIALAAQLALHYSQARDKGPEEVVMVEARFLRRVPGKRGAVTYASPRVLKVDPDPEALRRLRNPGT